MTFFGHTCINLCWFFFYDILIYNKCLNDHKTHLVLVLESLPKLQLYAKMSKSWFGCSKIKYLGHVISIDGVKANPSKISCMMQWPIPKLVCALRGFLSLTGYYHKFIKGYGTIAAPLTQLLRKYPFKWNESASQAFLQLKQALFTP